MLLPYLAALAEPVRNELANPAFRTGRYDVYRLERSVYETLRRTAAAERTGPVSELSEISKAVAEGKSRIEEVEEACRLVATKILSEKLLGSEAVEFDGEYVEHLASSLSRQIYIHALLERSESLLTRGRNATEGEVPNG